MKKYPRYAVLKMDLDGSFTKWKRGERVRVLCRHGRKFCIEKARVTSRSLPLTSQLCNVHAYALEFDTKVTQYIRRYVAKDNPFKSRYDAMD